MGRKTDIIIILALVIPVSYECRTYIRYFYGYIGSTLIGHGYN